MISSWKKAETLVRHMLPTASLRPHHKRRPKFKADVITNFGPGRECLSARFSSTTTTCLKLHQLDLGMLYFQIIFALILGCIDNKQVGGWATLVETFL